MKKLFLSMLLVCMISLTANAVSASSYSFNAKANKEVVNAGDKVTVSMEVNDIDTNDEGINVVEYTLEYDENVFESMNYVKKNDWDIVYNNDKNSDKFGKTLLSKMVLGVNSEEEIGNIEFKLKDNLQDMETEIKLKAVTSNDSKELINQGDRVIKLKILKKQNTDKPSIDTQTKEPTQNNNEKNINTSDKELSIVLAIILLVVSVNLVSIVLVKKLRNRIK